MTDSGQLSLRWKVLLIFLVLAVAGIAAFLFVRDDFCPGDSLLHPPAGTCIDPTNLIVAGSVEDVDEAVAKFGGRIVLPSRSNMHHVSLPVDGLEDLDRIKATLEAAGFEVLYAVVYELQ